MFKALCVAAALSAVVAAGPMRSAHAQALLQSHDPVTFVLANEELSLDALLSSYPVVPVAATGDGTVSDRALVIGAGAIAGVVALNFYMGGLAYLPFTGVVAATPLATAESIVAISRVYAVTAAVAGGLVANWLYERSGP
jgi:hypothetical protein